MSRVKGTPKTGGRKVGTPNKITGTIKEFLSDLIDSNREQIISDLKILSPRERLQIIEKFLQYVIPKQKEIELNGQTNNSDDYRIEDVLNFLGEAAAQDVEASLEYIANKFQDARYERIKKEKESRYTDCRGW